MLKKIVNSKFFIVGLLIGIASVTMVKTLTGNGEKGALSFPWWFFIFPPLAIYIFYKVLTFKKR